MSKVVKVEEIAFESAEWGRTKEVVNPQSVGSRNVKVKITEYLPGHAHELHIHPDQEEVIFVLSGKGATQWEGGKQEIGPGCVIFIPAGEPHANVNSSNSEPLRVIVIKSPPEDKEVKVKKQENMD